MRNKLSRGDKFAKFRELTFANSKQQFFERINFRELSKIEYFAVSTFANLPEFAKIEKVSSMLEEQKTTYLLMQVYIL